MARGERPGRAFAAGDRRARPKVGRGAEEAAPRRLWASLPALVALLVLGAPGAAHADAIDGPPACPPGARGRSSHSGTWCVPASCTADADCEGGATCVERRLCAIEVMVTPGGRRASPEPPAPIPVEMVVATCLPTETCTGTEEPWPDTAGHVGAVPRCAARRVCVTPPLPSLSELLGVEPPPAPPAAPTPVEPAATPAAPGPAPAADGSTCTARRHTSAPWPALVLALAALVLARRRV